MPYGTVTVMESKFEGTADGTRMSVREAYADGVGLVRLKIEINGNTVVQELKSYSPGK